MIEQVCVSVHAAIEHALMTLLDQLAPPALNAQATLFSGTGSDARPLARVAHAAATTAAVHEQATADAQEQATVDWPLSAENAPVGFLRFAAPAGTRHGDGDRSLSEAAAALADDARVKNVVASLADLVLLADYLRGLPPDGRRNE